MHHLSLLLLVVCPGATGIQTENGLRVATFNVRNANSEDPAPWPARRVLARELLELEKPDLIGTQEALYAQVRDLDTDLPEHDWIGLGREGGSHGEFGAIFFRRARLDPLEFDHFWLSDTPERVGSKTWGNGITRMVTWVRFRDRRTGREFYCFNTHFDHQSEVARERSARLLRERVQALDPSLPLLVLGDFNAAAGASRPYGLLVDEDGLSDAWVLAEKRGEDIGTFNGWGAPRPGGARIDWILTRGTVVVNRCYVSVYSKDGQYPSDHFPVLADVALGLK